MCAKMGKFRLHSKIRCGLEYITSNPKLNACERAPLEKLLFSCPSYQAIILILVYV